MYCSTCGNKLADDARFCSFCGAPTTASPQGAVPAPVAATPAQAGQGNLNAQVKRARRLSFAALSPTMLGLIIALLVCATAAAAAVFIYFTVYLPAQHAAQPQAEQTLDTPQHENAGVETPASDTSVFNRKLAQYQTALRSDWKVDADEVDEDVAGVAGLFGNDAASNGVGGASASSTVSYAIEDVNHDGRLELIIALVDENGSYRPLAVYTTDGSDVSTVVSDAPSAQPTTITLLEDGSVELDQTGQWGSVVIVDIEDGAAVERMRFEWGLSQGNLTWQLIEGGETTGEGEAGDLEEVFAHMPTIDNTPYSGLDWQPLSSFDSSAQ